MSGSPGIGIGLGNVLYAAPAQSLVTLPSGWTSSYLPSGFQIYRSSNGTYSTNAADLDWLMSALSVALPSSQTYYSPTGSSGNSGTKASPKQDVSAALQGASNKTVLLEPGATFYAGSGCPHEVNFATSPGVIVMGPWNGWRAPGIGVPVAKTTLSRRLDPAGLSWTLDQGTCYYIPYTATVTTEPYYAVDEITVSSAERGSLGTYLTSVASVALCRSTPNSYFKDTGALRFYVNVSRAPDTYLKVFEGHSAIQDTGSVDGVVIIHNCIFEGGWLQFTPASGSRQRVIFYNCEFRYGIINKNMVSCGGGVRPIFINCTAAGGQGQGDGFDYDTGAQGIEINCRGLSNGTSSTVNNGSTCHTGSTCLRIGGVYQYNLGRQIHDVTNSPTVNLGVTTAESTSTGTSKSGIGCGTGTEVTPFTMWCYDCIFGTGLTNRFFTVANVTINYRNSPPINTAGQALTDSGAGTLTMV